MKYFYLLLSLGVLFSCGGCTSKETSATKNQLSDEDAAILLTVFDSLKDLEDLSDVDKSNRAFSYALKYMDHIWEPMYRRMAVLSNVSVVSAEDIQLQNKDDIQKIKNRKLKEKNLQKYRDLRRSLIKILIKKPNDTGIKLLIYHLDKDIPEGKDFLEKFSGQQYGYDLSLWKKWLFARQMETFNIDKEQIINGYRSISDEHRRLFLKQLLKQIKKTIVTTGVDDQFVEKTGTKVPDYVDWKKIPKSTQGVVNSQNKQIAKMVAMIVFLEALNDNNQANKIFAIMGLKQLVKDGEEVIVKRIESSSDDNIKSQLIQVLGSSDSSRVASKLLYWIRKNQMRKSSLRALGNLTLNKEEALGVSGELINLLKLYESPDSETVALSYAALINLGDKKWFMELLKLCPEKKFSSNYIDHQKESNFGWLQMRRVLRHYFNQRYPDSNKFDQTMNNNESTSGHLKQELNPSNMQSAKFYRYIRLHRLNFNHDNWRKWYNDNMLD